MLPTRPTPWWELSTFVSRMFECFWRAFSFTILIAICIIKWHNLFNRPDRKATCFAFVNTQIGGECSFAAFSVYWCLFFFELCLLITELVRSMVGAEASLKSFLHSFMPKWIEFFLTADVDRKTNLWKSVFACATAPNKMTKSIIFCRPLSSVSDCRR